MGRGELDGRSRRKRFVLPASWVARTSSALLSVLTVHQNGVGEFKGSKGKIHKRLIEKLKLCTAIQDILISEIKR